MPIYEYEREDGSIFEIIQKMSDGPLSKCPTTGQVVKRKMSSSMPIFKGSGFYKTDYCSNSSSKSSSATTNTNSESSTTSSTAESKQKGCGTGCGCH